MLSKAASTTIFLVFGMTQPGIEPWSPRPLVNTLLNRPIACYTTTKKQKKYNSAANKAFIYIYIYIYIYIDCPKITWHILNSIKNKMVPILMRHSICILQAKSLGLLCISLKNTVKGFIFVFFQRKRKNFSNYSVFVFILIKNRHLLIKNYHTRAPYFVFLNKTPICFNYCLTNY